MDQGAKLLEMPGTLKNTFEEGFLGVSGPKGTDSWMDNPQYRIRLLHDKAQRIAVSFTVTVSAANRATMAAAPPRAGLRRRVPFTAVVVPVAVLVCLYIRRGCTGGSDSALVFSSLVLWIAFLDRVQQHAGHVARADFAVAVRAAGAAGLWGRLGCGGTRRTCRSATASFRGRARCT